MSISLLVFQVTVVVFEEVATTAATCPSSEDFCPLKGFQECRSEEITIALNSGEVQTSSDRQNKHFKDF